MNWSKGPKPKKEWGIWVSEAWSGAIFKVLFTGPPRSMCVKNIPKSILTSQVDVGAHLVDNREAKRIIGYMWVPSSIDKPWPSYLVYSFLFGHFKLVSHTWPSQELLKSWFTISSMCWLCYYSSWPCQASLALQLAVDAPSSHQLDLLREIMMLTIVASWVAVVLQASVLWKVWGPGPITAPHTTCQLIF